MFAASGRELNPRPWVIAFLLLACGTRALSQARAAEPTDGAAPAVRDEVVEELSEVLVSGEKPIRKVAELIPWLRRLVGQYTYSGYVDLGGKGQVEDRRAVSGGGTCIGFGVAPGVQCEINVRWERLRDGNGAEVLGGSSPLSPAMVLYGLEPDARGINYLQVDNIGRAEGAVGYLFNDTAVFRAPCSDDPTRCQRVTRITARPDDRFVEMQVDTEVEFVVTARYRFQLQRVATPRGYEASPRR